MMTSRCILHFRLIFILLVNSVGSVYTKQNTHSKLYSIDKSIKVNCTNGKEQKKSYVKNNAEVTCNWGTEYKSETYKYTTFYMYIKLEKVTNFDSLNTVRLKALCERTTKDHTNNYVVQRLKS